MKVRVGIEMHGYLKTKEKLFCKCGTNYQNVKPNTNICPVCTGQPGSKPMLPNKEALNKIIKLSLMLGCKINKKFVFQRKHYDWPDLPNGYQKTVSGSYSLPIGHGGEFLGIRIRDVHLEEDPARWNPDSGRVDYNRCGMCLVELVTEPDFDSAEQVRQWLQKLMAMLGYIDILDTQAGIKCDTNIDVDEGERVEVKNINSLWSIVRAIEYESERQVKEGAVQETRMFDEKTKKTYSMRTKEEAADYRYIPEPDLPVIHISDSDVKKLEKELPESPHEKAIRFANEFKISRQDAEVICSDFILGSIFEKVAAKVEPHLALRWLKEELVRVLNYNKLGTSDLKIGPKELIDLLSLISEKKITENVGKKILNQLVVKKFDVKKYISKNKLVVVVAKGKLEDVCKKVISKNKRAVDDYKSGNENVLNFLVGQVMRETKGAADHKTVSDLLKKLL